MNQVKSFKELPTTVAYFSFENEEEAPKLEPANTNVFVKTGKTEIRKVGGKESLAWRKNSQVVYYGQDINSLLPNSQEKVELVDVRVEGEVSIEILLSLPKEEKEQLLAKAIELVQDALKQALNNMPTIAPTVEAYCEPRQKLTAEIDE